MNKNKKIPKEKKGFNKLPEAVQKKISPKLDSFSK